MAYNTEELFTKAKQLITEKNLVFHSDVFGLLAISSETYYSHFPKESNEYKVLDNLLTQNKVTTKNGLRAKWYHNDNATAQIALYKLIGSKEERQLLSQNYTDITSNGQSIGMEKIIYPKQLTEDGFNSLVDDYLDKKATNGTSTDDTQQV